VDWFSSLGLPAEIMARVCGACTLQLSRKHIGINLRRLLQGRETSRVWDTLTPPRRKTQ
jgi:hypothetical protein